MLAEPQVSNMGFGFRPGERAGNSLAASLEDYHVSDLGANIVSRPISVY